MLPPRPPRDPRCATRANRLHAIKADASATDGATDERLVSQSAHTMDGAGHLRGRLSASLCDLRWRDGGRDAQANKVFQSDFSGHSIAARHRLWSVRRVYGCAWMRRRV